MFPCWRTLTAAAGALCLPYAFLQAPSLGDDFAGTCPAISAPNRNFTVDAATEQDRAVDSLDSATESADQGMSLDFEGRCNDPSCPCHETLDQQFSRRSNRFDTSDPVVDEGTDSSITSDQFTNLESEPTGEFVDDRMPFDDTCTDPNCESNQPGFTAEPDDTRGFQPDEVIFDPEPVGSSPESEQFDDESAQEMTDCDRNVTDANYPQCPFGCTTRYMDVYEPYANDAETGDERSTNRAPAVLLPNLEEIDRRVPSGDSFVEPLGEQSDGIEDGCEDFGGAQLSGTIEPEEDNDEADQESFDAAAQQQADAQIGEGDRQLEEDSDAIGEFQPESTFEANEDSGDETSAKPPIHLFYPGHDWTPYYPAESGTEEDSEVIPTDPTIERAANPWMVRLPFHGAACTDHGAVATVTWTGKLAERCATLIEQSFPQVGSTQF